MNKEINFYWGNEEMSWLRYMTLVSFIKHNPEWKVNLYLDKSVELSKVWATPEVQDFFVSGRNNYLSKIEELGVEIKNCNGVTESAKTPAQKSDLFKWHLLATEGGFYSDMDIVFLKSIDKIYDISKEYEAGLTYTSYFSIGFMFSSGNNKIFERIYLSSINGDQKDYQGYGVKSVYKVYPTIKDMGDKVFNIPMKWFYYNDSDHVDNIFLKNNYDEVKNNSYGLHWYAGHPLAQEFNNQVNKENCGRFETTIGKALVFNGQ